MSKASRAKGMRREREALKELSDWLGDDYPPLKRNYAQVSDGGADCIDLPGVAIEVKGVERFRSAWFDQAAEQCRVNQLPVVMWKQNRKPWRCFVEMTPAQLADYIRNQ